jgi:peptidoglycan/xylan/chitin deacetylase (PgdA/CDA1 family)
LSITKTIARQLIYPAITTLGLENLFSAFGKANKLILVYHGVVEKPMHQVSVGPVDVAQFEKHLQYFKKHFDVVSQDAIFDMYRRGINPTKKTIAITFDDGYENNYTRAYPLLKKYNFPATMYIISSCIEQEDMITWYDYIDFVKQDLNPAQIDTTVINKPQVNSISALKELIKTLNIDRRQVLYAEIAKQVDIQKYITQYPREHWKLMSPSQIKELAESGLIEIGAHTHNHPNLGLISPTNVREEVRKSKQALEKLIGKPVNSIAFPDGSYTDEVKKICTEEGYKNLLAVDYRCTSDEADKNILPRWCTSSTTTYEANMILIHKNFKQYSF